jgi:hypothetical protein
MGTKYSTNSASGYNSSPPPDDGSTGSDNLVTWAKHKTKLADPLKTLAEAINTDLVAWADVSPTAKATNYTTLTSDHLRVIETSSSITVTLGASSSMGAGYEVTVKAVSGTTTVSTGETIDGSASDRTLTAGEAETYVVNNSGSGYMLKQNKGITTTELSGLLLDEDDMASDSDTDAPTQQSVKVYVDGKIQLGGAASTVEVFVSSAITYTAAAQAFTVENHGLSGTPQEIQAYAKCVSSDNGYAVNDYVSLGSGNNSRGTDDWGVSVWATSTQVDGKVGANGLAALNKSTGASTALSTSSKWEVYIVAKYYA